jgi:Immunity protein 52
VLVEHLPNGGLLMSATTETFDVENPAHMAAARAIGAAIAPLNDLPWAERARA